MENEEQKIRADLVRFILANDPTVTPQELESYSITALTIIKTALEIRIKYKTSGDPENQRGS